jgi:hypothetical protein
MLVVEHRALGHHAVIGQLGDIFRTVAENPVAAVFGVVQQLLLSGCHSRHGRGGLTPLSVDVGQNSPEREGVWVPVRNLQVVGRLRSRKGRIRRRRPKETVWLTQLLCGCGGGDSHKRVYGLGVTTYDLRH